MKAVTALVYVDRIMRVLIDPDTPQKIEAATKAVNEMLNNAKCKRMAVINTENE